MAGLKEGVFPKSHPARRAPITVGGACVIAVSDFTVVQHPSPFLLHEGNRWGDRKHFEKSTALQVLPSNLFTTSAHTHGISVTFVCSGLVKLRISMPPKESLHVPRPGSLDRMDKTTHRFHSESFEKLGSLQPEDLMSQLSHQKITWMRGRKKVTRVIQWDWAEDCVSDQFMISFGGQHPCQECSYSTGWLSRHMEGHSQEATTSATHFGADITIAASSEGSGITSYSISSSTQESNLQVINFPRPRLLNETRKWADSCDRQTDTCSCVRKGRQRCPQQKELAPGKGEIEMKIHISAPLNLREDFN